MQNPGIILDGVIEQRMGSMQDVHFEFHDEQDEY